MCELMNFSLGIQCMRCCFSEKGTTQDNRTQSDRVREASKTSWRISHFLNSEYHLDWLHFIIHWRMFSKELVSQPFPADSHHCWSCAWRKALSPTAPSHWYLLKIEEWVQQVSVIPQWIAVLRCFSVLPRWIHCENNTLFLLLVWIALILLAQVEIVHSKMAFSGKHCKVTGNTPVCWTYICCLGQYK